MKRFMKSDRDQVMLFSHTIADNLEENHEVYAFAALLDKIPMKPFLSKYSKEGGRAYHPVIMLGCLFYGFHRGWRSSRELQKACEENDAMRYLVGGHKVKFRSIAEFRVNFGKEIGEVFNYSVSLLSHKKKNIGTDVKVDGTKIKASAADDQTYKKSDLEERKRAIQQEILEYLRSGMELDIEEDKLYGKDNSGYELNPEEVDTVIEEFIRLQKASEKAKRESLKTAEGKQSEPAEFSTSVEKDSSETMEGTQDIEALKTGEKEVEVFLEDTTNSHANEPELLINEDQAAEDNDSVMLRKAQKYVTISKSLEENQESASDSKINLTDPDAKFMKRNGKISQSYNIQVTSSEGYILAADIAEANSENDLEQLAPTLSKAESNTGTSIRTASADSGYFHSSGLEYLDSKGINGFIPSPDQVAKERKGEEGSGYEAHQFKYDEDDDSWVCPEGKTLEFHNESVKDKKKYTHYHGKPPDCVICPAREQCCTSEEELRRGYRKLSVDSGFALKHEMIKKMNSEEAKSFYKKRGSEIEPIFGILKQAKKFREFLLRGSKKVQIEVKIAATAFNFGKMVREQLA